MTVSGFFRSAHAKLLLAAAVCCFANLAHAALSTLTVNATLPAQAVDFSDQPLTFSQFDPTLGKLQSVRISVHSTSQLTQQYENTSDQEQTIAARQTLDLILELPDGTTPVIKDRQAVAHTYAASEFDGNIDFDGTSGATTDYGISSTNQKLLKSRAKLAMFTGSQLASLFLSANSDFRASNKGNQLVAEAQAFTGVEVGIIYSYIAAVPEPVDYGLAAGLLAFAPFLCRLCRRKAGRDE
jgi:hypothetical protein